MGGDAASQMQHQQHHYLCITPKEKQSQRLYKIPTRVVCLCRCLHLLFAVPSRCARDVAIIVWNIDPSHVYEYVYKSRI